MSMRVSPPFRVVIADERQDSRECLRNVLGPFRHRIEIAAEADNPDSTTESIKRFEPHVLLLDYSLFSKLGPLRRLDSYSNTRAIIILAKPDKSQIINSFRWGGFGVFLKGSPRRTLWRSIVTVMAGQYCLGDEPLAALVQTIRDSRPAGNGMSLTVQFGLTQREIEIVQRIADGRSNKEVGQDFSICERTVKHHLTNIFGKVGVSSRLELALLVRDHQLFAPPNGRDTLDRDVSQQNTWRAEERPDSIPATRVREYVKLSGSFIGEPSSGRRRVSVKRSQPTN